MPLADAAQPPRCAPTRTVQLRAIVHTGPPAWRGHPLLSAHPNTSILKGSAVHPLLQEAFFPNPPRPPLLGTPMTTLLRASSRAAGTGKYYYLRDVLTASPEDTYFKTRS